MLKIEKLINKLCPSYILLILKKNISIPIYYWNLSVEQSIMMDKLRLLFDHCLSLNNTN